MDLYALSLRQEYNVPNFPQYNTGNQMIFFIASYLLSELRVFLSNEQLSFSNLLEFAVLDGLLTLVQKSLSQNHTGLAYYFHRCYCSPNTCLSFVDATKISGWKTERHPLRLFMSLTFFLPVTESQNPNHYDTREVPTTSGLMSPRK